MATTYVWSPSPVSTRVTGTNFENIALKHLEAHGLILVTRNYRVRDGEIDLIMREGEWLLFVEVKYRRDAHFADVLEQIRPEQLSRIRRSAMLFMLQHNIKEHLTACRFDLVVMSGEPLVIEWFKDAF